MTDVSDDGAAVLVEAKLEVYDIAAENERLGNVDGELIWMGFRLLLPGGARFRGRGMLVIAVPVVCIVVELPIEAGEPVSLWLRGEMLGLGATEADEGIEGGFSSPTFC